MQASRHDSNALLRPSQDIFRHNLCMIFIPTFLKVRRHRVNGILCVTKGTRKRSVHLKSPGRAETRHIYIVYFQTSSCGWQTFLHFPVNFLVTHLAVLLVQKRL